MNFDKKLLDPRYEQYECLGLWGNNGECVLSRPEAAKPEIDVFSAFFHNSLYNSYFNSYAITPPKLVRENMAK